MIGAAMLHTRTSWKRAFDQRTFDQEERTMRSQTWTIVGAAVVAAGALMLGFAYATSGVVHAGSQIPCDATPVIPTATPVQLTFGTIPGSDVAMAGIVAQADSVVPQCTETPTPETPSPTPQQRLKTHTPTPTDTETPKTNTPVPTSTQSPPTSTPKAASEAVSVKPPNTGSGIGGSGDITLWLLALGAASFALGGGAILVGVRHR
jgi:outer membrane biosynthesis protein TonB